MSRGYHPATVRRDTPEETAQKRKDLDAARDAGIEVIESATDAYIGEIRKGLTGAKGAPLRRFFGGFDQVLAPLFRALKGGRGEPPPSREK